MHIFFRFLLGAAVFAIGIAAIWFAVGRLPATDSALTDDQAAGDAAQSAAAPSAAISGGHPANADLGVNAAGLKIIEESEGLRLEAYQSGGRWFIGYGHSRTARSGMVITAAQAEELLRDDVREFESGVKGLLAVPVSANEFSAMVSLAYNLGIGGFKRSQVLARINEGDRQGAADAFLRHNKAGGREIPHLTERRQKERALFLS